MNLFEDNIGLVESIVKRMDFGHFEKDDLRQAGLMGLFKASTRFDESLGICFSTYATTYIVGEIKKEMRENQTIKLNKEMFRIIRYLKKMECNINNSTTIDKIAIDLNTSKENVLMALNYQEKVISLNIQEENGELINLIKDQSKAIISYDEICEILDSSLSNIIFMRYFNGLKQGEVAQILNITQSKVSRLETKALRILKEVYLS